jgi:hypothetical protein
MITQHRKGRDKYVVSFSPAWAEQEQVEIRDWCQELFGPSGRTHKYRWRYGWSQTTNNYYFKHEQDLMLFIMKWA